MRFFLVLTILLFLLSEGKSQYSINGAVIDSISKEPLKDALITIINAKDSFLVTYGRSDIKGRFHIEDSGFAKYPLLYVLISYPGYVTFSSGVVFHNQKTLELKEIKLITKEHLLQEVIVSNKVSAIRVINDTLEFKADSFWVAKNADVNSLLKQLPGLQINEDGTIYAYGERVKRILVDGEEYFSRDPILVSRIVRADIVDKVQLYDQKSERSAITGINDGKNEKVINLKIKEEKKKSVFGKVSSGFGNKSTYNNELMANRFNDKSKTAIFGILSSIGKIGLTSREEDNYGNDEVNGSLSNLEMQELDNWNGRFENNGLPTFKTFGLHNNDKSKNSSVSYNSDFRFSDLSINGLATTKSEYILPSGNRLFSNDSVSSSNRIKKNGVFGVADIKVDSLSTMKISINARNFSKTSYSQHFGGQQDQNNTFANYFLNRRSVTTDGFDISPAFIYKHRFSKVGSVLSINTKFDMNDSKANGFVYIASGFNNGQFQADTIDQYKILNTKRHALSSSVSFSQPILKGQGQFSLSYQFLYSGIKLIRNSYNQNRERKYLVLDTLFSNDYKIRIIMNRIGSGFNLRKKGYSLNGGLEVELADYFQDNYYQNQKTHRQFTNWYPKATVSVSLGKLKSISMSYVGETIQPRIDQLQPLRNNSEPLVIFEGNEFLRPSFNHVLQFTYLNRRPIEAKNIWSTFTILRTQNGFSSRDSVDVLGRKYTKSINIEGVGNVNFYAQYDFRSKKSKINFSTGITANRSSFVNVINSVDNKIINKSVALTGIMRKSVSGKYDLMLRYSISANDASSSLIPSSSFFYLTNNFRFSFDNYCINKMILHTDFSASILSRTGFFGNNVNLYIWNASITKKLLKNENLSIQLSVNDILNSNRGIVRSALTNIATERRNMVLNKYALFSLIWNFNRTVK